MTTTRQRNNVVAGHRCGHGLDSDSTPFQRDFPEIWHDTPGQYIECTCKLTISINIMTNNIMIFNQLSNNATIYPTCCDYAQLVLVPQTCLPDVITTRATHGP